MNAIKTQSIHQQNNLKNNRAINPKVIKARKTMHSSKGMTLVEIVVALALLVVIMFFMSSTQMSALKMNHKTSIIRELTHTAEREIENRRQIPEQATVVQSTAADCFFEVEDYSCSTMIHPCSIVSGNVVCVNTNQAAFLASEAVSHQIVVDVLGPEQRTIRLQTIVEAEK